VLKHIYVLLVVILNIVFVVLIMLEQKEKLVNVVSIFSNADKSRTFNFSSGNLGSIPIRNQGWRIFLSDQNLAEYSYIDYLWMSIKLLIPYKNVIILSRSLLRKILNTSYSNKNKITMLSLGGGEAGTDPYFGSLPALVLVNYLKIVPGFKIKSKSYNFVESQISIFTLIKLFILSPFVGSYFLAKLYSSAISIENKRIRKLFIILALNEIGNGAAINQYILVKGLIRHLRLNNGGVILYPMEGRNWEKLLNENRIYLGAKCIGYLHCAITPKHCSLLFPGLTRPVEWPDISIAPGEMPYVLLKKIHPDVSIRKGYFLRGNPAPANASGGEIKAVVALTGDLSESLEVLQRFAEIPQKLFRSIGVRLNINAPSYRRLSSLVVELGFSLCDSRDLIRPEICFFRSSSVAVDYLRRGTAPVYIINNDIIDSNMFSLDRYLVIKSINLNCNFLGDFLKLFEDSQALAQAAKLKSADYYLDQDFLENDLRVFVTEVCDK